MGRPAEVGLSPQAKHRLHRGEHPDADEGEGDEPAKQAVAGDEPERVSQFRRRAPCVGGVRVSEHEGALHSAEIAQNAEALNIGVRKPARPRSGWARRPARGWADHDRPRFSAAPKYPMLFGRSSGRVTSAI